MDDDLAGESSHLQSAVAADSLSVGSPGQVNCSSPVRWLVAATNGASDGPNAAEVKAVRSLL